MLDQRTGWAFASTGTGHDTVVTTADGGRSWNDVSPPGVAIRAHYFMDAGRAWVLAVPSGTSNLRVLRTVDGGKHWQSGPDVGPSGSVPPQLEFADVGHGWKELARREDSVRCVGRRLERVRLRSLRDLRLTGRKREAR